MIQSMTGYGKAEITTSLNEKFTVEIRSLNGKTCDLSVKTSLIPRDKELEIRQIIAKELIRGNIDLYINVEYLGTPPQKQINTALLKGYYQQLAEAEKDSLLSTCDTTGLLAALLKLPDVIDTQKAELTAESWNSLYCCILEAVSHLIAFRQKEGNILKEDIYKRADLIESFVAEVEKYEKERIESIKERLRFRLDELSASPDPNRLEQEIIYYLEKLDINEEKVRLRQHCRYFRETIDKEEYPGKKLGFIAQEMGREINTMGSKANHSEIQKWVVKMKDELEKIKEQSLNIL